MNFRRIHLLWIDRDAVVGQPISLLMVLIVAGIITTLLCLSIPYLMKESQIQNVEGEIDRILIEATNMFEYADNGSLRTISVEFPSSLHGMVPMNQQISPSTKIPPTTTTM
jgi:competence protein ComGC